MTGAFRMTGTSRTLIEERWISHSWTHRKYRETGGDDREDGWIKYSIFFHLPLFFGDFSTFCYTQNNSLLSMNEQTRINATISYCFLWPLFLLAKSGTSLRDPFVRTHAVRSSIIISIGFFVYLLYIFLLRPFSDFIILILDSNSCCIIREYVLHGEGIGVLCWDAMVRLIGTS